MLYNIPFETFPKFRHMAILAISGGYFGYFFKNTPMDFFFLSIMYSTYPWVHTHIGLCSGRWVGALKSALLWRAGLTIDCCCWFWFWSRLSADDLKIGLDKVEALKVKTSVDEFGVGPPPTKVEQGLKVPWEAELGI